MEKAYKVTDCSWYCISWNVPLKFNFAKSKNSIFPPILLVTWKEHACCRFNLLLIQFFSVSPRFGSSFRKCASVSTSLKTIQKTYSTHESRKEQQNSFQPTWAFPASPAPSPGALSPRKAGQALARRESDAGVPEPVAHGGMATASAQCPVPPTPSEGCKRCPAALILPSQSSPTSIQPTPYMFCGSWPKYPGAVQPFTTLILSLCFSVFLTETLITL